MNPKTASFKVLSLPLCPSSPSPSQTLPPSTSPLSPPHSHSYSASAPAPTHEGGGKTEAVLVNKKPSINHRPSGNTKKDQGGADLELLTPAKFALSSKEMQEFMSVWNGAMVLPRISSLRGRENLVRRAMADEFFRENYRLGIKKIAASKFCRGHNRQGTGMRPWKASVEWFLHPASLPKIIEGRYDNDQEPEVTPEEQKFSQENL